jgi:hypothetical protein
MVMSFQTGQGAQRFTLSATNPNPLENCACSPHGRAEDGGPPFVIWTADEPISSPHFVTCAGCILGCAKQLGHEPELADAGESQDNPATLHNEAPGPSTDLVGFPTGRPEPHVNPTADTLEEATRLLDAQIEADEDPLR